MLLTVLGFCHSFGRQNPGFVCCYPYARENANPGFVNFTKYLYFVCQQYLFFYEKIKYDTKERLKGHEKSEADDENGELPEKQGRTAKNRI